MKEKNIDSEFDLEKMKDLLEKPLIPKIVTVKTVKIVRSLRGYSFRGLPPFRPSDGYYLVELINKEIVFYERHVFYQTARSALRSIYEDFQKGGHKIVRKFADGFVVEILEETRF